MVGFMTFLEKEDIKIRYEEMGIDNDETIFLLNGGFMQIESWKPVAELLSQNYHVVLHDMRCQGASTCPDRLCFDDHVKDIISIMNYLEIEKANFVGISFGGIVGQLLALENSDRLKTLTLIATLSELPDDSYYNVLKWAEGSKSGDARKFTLSWITDVYSKSYIRNNPELLERIIDRYNQFNQDFENFAKLLNSIEEIREKPLTEDIKKIEQPTLVISGEKSITREFTRKIHSQLPNSIHLEVPDSGHAIVVESPKEVTTILRGFLEEFYA